MTACIWACVWECVHACGSPRTYLFESGSHDQTQNSLIYLVLLASFCWQNPLSSSSLTRITGKSQYLPGIYVSSSDLNSSLDTCCQVLQSPSLPQAIFLMQSYLTVTEYLPACQFYSVYNIDFSNFYTCSANYSKSLKIDVWKWAEGNSQSQQKRRCSRDPWALPFHHKTSEKMDSKELKFPPRISQWRKRKPEYWYWLWDGR